VQAGNAHSLPETANSRLIVGTVGPATKALRFANHPSNGHQYIPRHSPRTTCEIPFARVTPAAPCLCLNPDELVGLDEHDVGEVPGQ
jgi:hypothetical protein